MASSASLFLTMLIRIWSGVELDHPTLFKIDLVAPLEKSLCMLDKVGRVTKNKAVKL